MEDKTDEKAGMDSILKMRKHVLVTQSCPTLWPGGLRARQAPLSMGFSKQEYWSGLPFPSGDFLDPGIKPHSPTLQADSLPSQPAE